MTRARQEALAVLADLFEFVPEIRMGQMMEFMGLIGEGTTGRKLGDIEDEEFLDVLYQHRKDMAALVAGRAGQPAVGGDAFPGLGVSAPATPAGT